jgi:hypothetical protein
VKTLDTCKVCPNQFSRKYPRGGQRKMYCSKRCRYKDSYITQSCKTCGREFTTNIVSTRKEYCSRSCIQRDPCQLCGKIITGRQTYQSGERKYCSRKCASIFNNSLQARKAYVIICFAFTIARLGKLRCERCPCDQISRLIAHHKDRNRKNNLKNNLETLCTGCHSDEHYGGSLKRQRAVVVAALLARHIHLLP